MATKNELKQRELWIISQLRKGHSRQWIASKLEEMDKIAPSTAINLVHKIGGELNKTKTELLQEAKEYIIEQLLMIIDESIDRDDIKHRLLALKQLGEVTKVTEDKNKLDLKIKFDFDK